MRAYTGTPLIYLGAAHIHRTLASQQARRVEPPDNESIKKALKNWIHVDLEKAHAIPQARHPGEYVPVGRRPDSRLFPAELPR